MDKPEINGTYWKRHAVALLGHRREAEVTRIEAAENAAMAEVEQDAAIEYLDARLAIRSGAAQEWPARRLDGLLREVVQFSTRTLGPREFYKDELCRIH